MMGGILVYGFAGAVLWAVDPAGAVLGGISGRRFRELDMAPRPLGRNELKLR